jgi:hypothetical protein
LKKPDTIQGFERTRAEFSPRMVGLALALLAIPAAAQWIDYPTPGTPRTKDGKPNLSAATPKTPNGKPDFSGVWEVPTHKFLENLPDGIEISMLPWAEKLYKERQDNEGKDRPSGRCLPHSVTDFDAHFTPKKVVQTPGVLLLLFESYHSFRQIFTDGRPLPKDPEPAWFGYSAGKWEGDTLVVNTVGVTEKTWLDDAGHPHSDSMRLIERFRRQDFGHMEVQLTIDDPKAYAKPWSVTIPWNLMPDTDLLDWVCENEKDYQHLVGK